MKTPLYNSREQYVLDSPEYFILRLYQGQGAPRREVRRMLEPGETPTSVWKSIVRAIARPPFNEYRISVYVARDRQHCAVSLQHCPWTEKAL